MSEQQDTQTVQQALNLAVQHHTQGRLPQAESIYNEILKTDPNQPIALHLLGVVAHQSGKNDKAVDLITKALSLKPDYAEAHGNLGLAFQELGQADKALASYRKALAIKPDFAPAHNNLGHILLDLGKPDDAISSLQKAVAIKPDHTEAHNNLGLALQDLGKLNDAVASYRKALSLKPNFAEAHNNLGVVLQAQGQLEGAVTSYQTALGLKPEYAEAHYNLGNALRDLGKLEEAATSYQTALGLKSDFAAAHNNLGLTLRELGKLGEAVTSYHKALCSKPDYAEAHNNLGVVLEKLGKLDDAVDSYHEALGFKPDLAEAHNNLGTALKALGRLDDALTNYRKALDLKPDLAEAHSNLLLMEQYRPRHNMETLYELHCEWDERHGHMFRANRPMYRNIPEPNRRLRIGFVSPDLGRHPVGYFVIGLFENLAEREIQKIVYSDRSADDLSERIKSATDIWHCVRKISDEDLTKAILDDQIDILIDLAGHSAKNRMLVFARKPAPLQVTWAGYVGTTGLSAIDYLVSDTYSTRADEEKYHSENVIRMPDGFICYHPPGYAPEVGPLPFKQNRNVTFGSFNNPSKLNAEVVSVWSRILEKAVNSRLLIKYRGIDSTTNIERLSTMFEANGIDRSRLKLEGHSTHAELLARYNDVDIALDPFPYSGGLTTCEALWMGVPVITVPGETFASRLSLSHLSTIGLLELVACDQDDYVESAVKLANNTGILTGLRAELREKMANSPVCDGKKFAEGFSTIMRKIWCDWCLSKGGGGRASL